MIFSATDEVGETVLNYSSKLMSADLPAPPGAETIRYFGFLEELMFDTSLNKDDVYKFYDSSLGKIGWKATDVKFNTLVRDMMVYRNDAKDSISVKVVEDKGKRHTTVRFRAAAEVAELAKPMYDLPPAFKKQAAEPKPK